eukprot:2537120-Rhodomonas_salina.1
MERKVSPLEFAFSSCSSRLSSGCVSCRSHAVRYAVLNRSTTLSSSVDSSPSAMARLAEGCVQLISESVGIKFGCRYFLKSNGIQQPTVK